EVGAFSEGDVRACELMAGLVTEVMAQTAEQELKQELATERASVLLALEKLKPQLQKLAGKPSTSRVKPVESAHAQPAGTPNGVGGQTNSLKTRYAMGADRPWPTMKRVVARAERCGIRKPHYRACGDAWHISSRKTAKEQLNAC